MRRFLENTNLLLRTFWLVVKTGVALLVIAYVVTYCARADEVDNYYIMEFENFNVHASYLDGSPYISPDINQRDGNSSKSPRNPEHTFDPITIYNGPIDFISNHKYWNGMFYAESYLRTSLSSSACNWNLGLTFNPDSNTTCYDVSEWILYLGGNKAITTSKSQVVIYLNGTIRYCVTLKEGTYQPYFSTIGIGDEYDYNCYVDGELNFNKYITVESGESKSVVMEWTFNNLDVTISNATLGNFGYDVLTFAMRGYYSELVVPSITPVPSSTPVPTNAQLDETNHKLDDLNETNKGILGKLGDLLTSIVELPKKLLDGFLDLLEKLFIPQRFFWSHPR